MRKTATLQSSIDEFLLSMTAARKASETIKWYRRRLTSLANCIGGQKALKSVTIGDLRRWQAGLAERDELYTDHPYREPKTGQLSQYTLHGYTRAARILFAWLVEEGRLETSPAERLELPQLPREPFKGIAVADMRKIINTAKDNPRNYALTKFLADTCCRVGGLVNLTLADLDLKAGRAHVHEKGQAAREVYLSKETVTALRQWLKVRPAESGDRVFVSIRSQTLGEELQPAGVWHILEKLGKRAGVDGKVGPHQWRHGGARAMIQNGAPLSVVSELLGHSDVGTTWRFYSALGSPQLQQAHKRYGWM